MDNVRCNKLWRGKRMQWYHKTRMKFPPPQRRMKSIFIRISMIVIWHSSTSQISNLSSTTTFAMFGVWPWSQLYTRQWITTKLAQWSGQWREKISVIVKHKNATRFILVMGKIYLGAHGETQIFQELSPSWPFFSAALRMTRSKRSCKRRTVSIGTLSKETSWTRTITSPTRPSWETSGSQSFVTRQSLLWRQMMTCSLISLRFEFHCQML